MNKKNSTTMNNRLQFRHHTPIFDSRDDAIDYIYSQIRFADEGLAFSDKSQGFSLFAEPTILAYKNEKDGEVEQGTAPNPHVMLVIGSHTNDSGQYNNNRFCVIDIDKTEDEIASISDKIENIAKALTIVTKDTNTLALNSESTSSGTVLSGDVKLAENQIFDNIRRPNVIMSTETGLFTYINLDYDENTNKLYFTVNGETKEWGFHDNSVVRGFYSKEDESLHLIRQDGLDITINMEDVLGEWSVEGEASKTPIVLTREEYKYGNGTDESHSHVEPWQDVLRADVRIASSFTNNILEKTGDGRYLYVDGSAKNITYYRDGEAMTVADALNECAKKKISTDSSNILYERADGIFATAALSYISSENTLVFTTSANSGGTSSHRIQLNSVALFKDVFYDHETEELVILYTDSNNQLQEVRINIGELITEWDIVNDAHNVKIHRERVVNGNDKISADVEIFSGNNNILQDVNHQLYVKGTADNILYSGETTVQDMLDSMSLNEASLRQDLDETSGKVETLREDFETAKEELTAADEKLLNDLNAEIERSTQEDSKHDEAISEISNKIGTGFTSDEHDNITAHFNRLSAATDTVSANTTANTANIESLSSKTESEITRATSEEKRIEDKFDTKLGDGFDERNTVRDELDKEAAARQAADSQLQQTIDTLSATTNGKLVDIQNTDHSIIIDKSDTVRPNIKVAISTESQDEKANIIKLNNDGLYVNVDLNYEYNAETHANRLIFSTTNGSKEFDLKTNSIVDRIYYDSSKEAIIVEYTVNGQRMPDVVVPVGDLIEEINVSDSTDGAIRLTLKRNDSGSTPSSPDIISAEVIVSQQEGNMLSNVNGALYVPNTQVAENQKNIEGLTARVGTTEANIETLRSNLSDETSRAISAETALNTLIASGDTQLQTNIDSEVQSRKTEIARLEESLNNEITRSTEKDNAQQVQIDNEISERKAEDLKLSEAIDKNKRQFKDTTTIGFIQDDGASPISVSANVKIAQADKNILISDGEHAGIYASVKLDYEEATNTLKLLGPNDILLSEEKLGEGSILDSITYDSENKDLVIIYKDSQGGPHEIRVPVADLFNEWEVKNPSSDSALYLEKISGATESGKIDVLWGKVLLAGSYSPDGHFEYGDNMIRIVANGLYVPGSGVTQAQEACKCLDSQLNSFETAVLGHEITQECGNGYVYEPIADASYIQTATSMSDADKILDKYIASAHTRIDEIVASDNCIAQDLKKTQEKILGFDITPCSEDISYPPHEDAHYISGATNMDDADALLDKAIYELSQTSSSVNLTPKNNALYIDKQPTGSTIEVRYLDAGLY